MKTMAISPCASALAQAMARAMTRAIAPMALTALAALAPGMAFASDRDVSKDIDQGHSPSKGILAPGVVSQNGSFKLQLQSVPNPIPLNEIFELLVTVDPSAANDASTNPVWLNAEAQMPMHKHGMNTRVVVEPLENNKFVIRGLLFHMSGEWLITFDIAKGRAHDHAEMRVEL